MRIAVIGMGNVGSVLGRRWAEAGHEVTMLYAGDDDGANRVAAGLAEELGFEPVYLGPLKEARLLEPLAMAWIVLARHRRLGGTSPSTWSAGRGRDGGPVTRRGVVNDYGRRRCRGTRRAGGFGGRWGRRSHGLPVRQASVARAAHLFRPRFIR